MTAKACWIMVAIAALAGCSSILGFKEPRLQDDGPDIDAAIDMPIDMAVCVPSACQFGCDTGTNMCKTGKLWIFKTTGSTVGNGFGGTDVPPNPRGGADGRCLATYNSRFATTRDCKTANVHAVLFVSATDSISLMASKYGIPTSVEVHRADDDVLVANNWNDLTDPTKTLRNPATTAATQAAGTVWTGTTSSATCRNWTSADTADTGTFGFTNRTEVTWLSEGVNACDSLFGLLCICWPGP